MNGPARQDAFGPGGPERSDAPAIEVRGLVSAFGDNVVHDHLDLSVDRGEVRCR